MLLLLRDARGSNGVCMGLGPSTVSQELSAAQEEEKGMGRAENVLSLL